MLPQGRYRSPYSGSRDCSTGDEEKAECGISHWNHSSVGGGRRIYPDSPGADGNVFHERMDQGNLSLCGIPGRSVAGRAVDPEKITEASTDIFGDRHGGFVPVHHDQYAVLT